MTVTLVSTFDSELQIIFLNLRPLNAKAKVLQTFVLEHFADDADFVPHSEEDMLTVMDLFSRACTTSEFTISEKTKIMFPHLYANLMSNKISMSKVQDWMGLIL